MSVPTIQPERVYELQKNGEVDLIDVRTPVEFREVHASSATNFPLGELDPNAVLSKRADPSQPLYVMCRTGNRGRQACEKLIAAGCTNVFNVEGGIVSWEEHGLPVKRGKKMMSLERQVRIAAGSLVLIGAILALLLHPAFVGLCAFIGAGLVFAGVTDTCGMGMLIAKMPWNQVKEKKVACNKDAACSV